MRTSFGNRNLRRKAAMRWLAGIGMLIGVASPAGLLTPAFQNMWITNQPGADWTNRVDALSIYCGHVAGNTNDVMPAAGTNRLAWSAFAQPSGGSAAQYAIGDELTPPSGVATNVPVIEPTSAVVAVWSPFNDRLYAAGSGVARITWVLTNGATRTIIYTISGAAAKPPVTLFWTEQEPGRAYGPPVSFGNSDTYNQHIVYNNQVTSTNDVWIAEHALHAARNVRGRFLLVYTQMRAEDGTNVEEQVGWEIVEVKEPVVNIIEGRVGGRLRSVNRDYETNGITAQVRRGIPSGSDVGDESKQYVYVHNGGHMNGYVYAVQPTLFPWQVEIYWLRKGVLDVWWPYEIDDYGITWPSSPQINVIGTATNAGPGVKIPSDLSTRLWTAQDPPGHASLENAVFSATNQGLALLQYTSQEGDTWFDVICSIWHDDTRVFAQEPIDWPIGTELEPKDTLYALHFDGSNSYVTATNNACTNSQTFSVEMWVKPDALTGSGSSANLFLASAGDPATSYSYMLRYHSRNPNYGCFGFYVWDGSPKWALAPTTFLLESNRWYHVAATVKKDDQIRLYIDGQEVASCGVGSPQSDGHMMFAASHGGGYTNTFRGSLTDIRVWNRQLSRAEIRAGMNTPLSGEEQGLAAWYPLLLDDSNTIYDCSTPVSESNPKNAVLVGGITHQTLIMDTACDGTPMSAFSAVPGYLWSGTAYNTNLYHVPMADDGSLLGSSATNLSSYIYGINTGRMEVWWFEAGNSELPVTIYWPSFPVHYNLTWPETNEIVIAGGEGSGALPDDWEQPELYVQNRADLPGYNPNEEHALILGQTVYALRDDLNIPSSSEPYVLLQYRDPQRKRPYMALWEVHATNSTITFTYTNNVAGRLIQAPNPLSQLPDSLYSHVFSGPAWRDRKGDFWAYRGGTNGGTASVQCRYYYPVQNGFWFPSLEYQPATGTDVPWLSHTDGLTGTPQTVTYEVRWPDDAPEMKIAETLVKAKNGLPDITGQKSAQVLYQQSCPLAAIETHVTTQQRWVISGRWVELGTIGWVVEYRTNLNTIVMTNQVEVQQAASNSVVLMDPTISRGVHLAQPPSNLDVNTVVNPDDGMTYFADLPPDLRERCCYNPNAGAAENLLVKGVYREPVGADDYLLLNMLTSDEQDTLLGLSSNILWQQAVTQLPTNILAITSEDEPFDSLALSAAVGTGNGYVTLAFNNSTNLCQAGDPISLSILRVVPELYVGDLNLTYPDNPLSEKTSLRYSADLAGCLDDYQFQWRYQSQLGSGLPPTPYSATDPRWIVLTNTVPYYSIEGPGLKALQDLYFTCRYRPVNPDNPAGTNTWSGWTEPKLHENWIKRVLKAINPYDQRFSDWTATGPNTLISMIAQAGTRYEGDIPFNQAALNDQGLISIYRSVLNRGIDMTIDGIPPQEDANADNALMMAAGRISQLYMLLGNEAFADALDPTLVYSIGDDPTSLGADISSLFCFMNQVPTLLDEELALLRGRDGSADPQPPITQAPVYNRLPWNFTSDIMGGQLAYALNYDIRSQTNSAGAFTEEVAAELYPQGHGDAYGHYLSAIKGYYTLLHHPYFKWWPMSEAIHAGDDGSMTIDVSFMHERRMAQAAAARAKTAHHVASQTWRRDGDLSPSNAWQNARDHVNDRAWGAADWAARGSQGAYFDWVMINALLPVNDSAHSGIEKIDRSTVPELDTLVREGIALQDVADCADQGLNALGLSQNAIPFDISAAGIDQGKSHFEQIYERALTALRNARTTFDHATDYAKALRKQNDSFDDFLEGIESEEQALDNRLIELLGYPYSDDIGPGKTYPQGYNGPDYMHANYVDMVELTGMAPTETVVSVTLSQAELAGVDLISLWGGAVSTTVSSVSFDWNYTGDGFMAKPASWTGNRRAQGEVQQAVGDFIRAWYRLKAAEAANTALTEDIIDLAILWQATSDANTAQFLRLVEDNAKQVDYTFAAMRWGLAAGAMEMTAQVMGDTAGSIVQSAQLSALDFEGLYTIEKRVALGVGLGAMVPALAALTFNIFSSLNQTYKEQLGYQTQEFMATNAAPSQIPVELMQKYREQVASQLNVRTCLQEMIDAFERYKSAMADAQRILSARSTLRDKTTAELKDYRYKDMAFRLFRHEALEKYRSAFELAARYAFLAAKAYDYETGLLDASDAGSPAAAFMEQIMRASALGDIRDGVPQVGNGVTGDPGLADALARMQMDWSVIEGRLGFNNPQSETGRFSLRSELFRISPQASSDEKWQQMLRRCVVGNLCDLPVFQQYALPFNPQLDEEPAIVIPFSSEVFYGKNFFGHSLAAGDNAYDPTHFATKIRAVGIWFDNYQGCAAATNGEPALANQPRVYLIPAGSDIIRAPAGDSDQLRSWNVIDQAIPLPCDISGSDLDAPDWNATQGSLLEQFARIRRIPSLRAYHDDGTFDEAEFCSNSRLIGRSVWNTQWYLIIPAGYLLDDRSEAINRFIYGPSSNGTGRIETRDASRAVKDIKLMFKTYSYFGE